MKRFYPLVVIAIVMFVVAAPLRAQSGCADSPENPTAILGFIGIAGAGMAQLRGRIKKK
jgi:XrtJ-associated TM-motif-TM protein